MLQRAGKPGRALEDRTQSDSERACLPDGFIQHRVDLPETVRMLRAFVGQLVLEAFQEEAQARQLLRHTIV